MKSINKLRAVVRLFGLIIFTSVWILAVAILLMFSRDKLSTSIRARTFWINCMLPWLGVQVNLRGDNRQMPSCALYVGNHRSYLDPIIALRYIPAVVIAKSEVAKWPVIGTAARLGGTVFVVRGSRSSRQATLQTMESVLTDRRSVLVFPEGTTSKAPQLLSFKPGAFQLASRINIAVVPFAIEYENPADAWIGDDTFIPHFIRVFGRKRTIVEMQFGPANTAADANSLLSLTHKWIGNTIKAMNS